MQPAFPFPEEVIEGLLRSPVQAFSHDVVMDAIDVSMAIERHLLVYAIEGLFQLDTDEASWRLPPTRAGWIPAGQLVHSSTIQSVRCISVFFKADFVTTPPTTCQVFNATPLIREMIKYSLRWTSDRKTNDNRANRFFLTLMDLCQEQMQASNLFTLPKAQSGELETVLQHTLDHLSDDLKLEEVAELVSMSSRTLTRRFHAEIHITWRQYLQQARMLRAMDYLAAGLTVTETALEVGFTNMSAFSTAFQKYTGHTPSHYQGQIG